MWGSKCAAEKNESILLFEWKLLLFISNVDHDMSLTPCTEIKEMKAEKVFSSAEKWRRKEIKICYSTFKRVLSIPGREALTFSVLSIRAPST